MSHFLAVPLASAASVPVQRPSALKCVTASVLSVREDELTEVSTLRVMGWNFLEGGLSPPDSENKRTVLEDRRNLAKQMVDRLNPDILVLNEALGCVPGTEPYTDYAAYLGFPHGAAATYDGAWGNAIVSRFPIVAVREGLIHPTCPNGKPVDAPHSTVLNRGWLAVQVQTPQGLLWVGTYHPHPSRSPYLRRRDTAEVLDAMPGNALFVGDLNAVALDEGVKEESLHATFLLIQSPERAAQSAALFYHSGRALFDPEEGLFPGRGWQQAITAPQSTIPTALFRRPGDDGMRIDHIMTSPNIQVHKGWIEQAWEADGASDHYPVIADVVLPAQGF